MARHTYHDVLAYFGVGGAHPGGFALTKEIVRNLSIQESDRILDAGCGTGQTAAFLARTYGCHVTALDQHPVMIDKARKRLMNEGLSVDLVEGKIESSSLRAGSFDWIIAESVTIFTAIQQTVHQYARLLRRGGTLLDLEMSTAASFSGNEMKRFQEVYGIDHIPEVEEWGNICREAGFQTVETVRESTIDQLLHKEPSATEAFDQQEIDVTATLNPALYVIWNNHMQLTDDYSDRLKYVVFKAKT